MQAVKCYICGKEIFTEKKADVNYCHCECYYGERHKTLEKKAEAVKLPAEPEKPKSLNPDKPQAKVFNPLVCEFCGGPRSGRGYSHTEKCKLYKKPIEQSEKRFCPLCGGPAKGRGFRHTIECKIAAKIAKQLEN